MRLGGKPGGIGDERGIHRLGERLELRRVERRHERVEPGDELRRWQDPSHDRRLAHARRDKIGRPRFRCGLALLVVRVEALGGLGDRGLQRVVFRDREVVPHQVHAERAVGMHTRAHWLLELLEVGGQPLREERHQRLEVLRPRLRVGVVPRQQLALQLERPRQPVRHLELPAVLEEPDLAGDVRWGEVAIQLLADQRRGRELRKHLQRADERPGRVDRRMPVVTAVERAGLLEVVHRTICRFPHVAARCGARLRAIEAGERHRRQHQRHRQVERLGFRHRQRAVEGIELSGRGGRSGGRSLLRVRWSSQAQRDEHEGDRRT